MWNVKAKVFMNHVRIVIHDNVWNVRAHVFMNHHPLGELKNKILNILRIEVWERVSTWAGEL